MNKYKSVANGARFHGKILLKGIRRVVSGAAVTGLIGMSVCFFTMIPNEGGYVAVLNFFAAAVTLGIAVGGVYAIGGGKKNKGGFEK